ncbi:MAG: helix-turn-helix domain-containing protein [Thermodesulfobacteriota bacterium]|nr:helix-turn-helix domain-containing protein [Thermodesulfobacteriota bacterium]
MQIPNNIIETAISLKDGYFDLPGLAKYCSLKIPTLRNHIVEGLPAYKVKGKLLIKRSEFDRWIKKFRIEQDLNHLVDGIVDSLKG